MGVKYSLECFQKPGRKHNASGDCVIRFSMITVDTDEADRVINAIKKALIEPQPDANTRSMGFGAGEK